uniref:plexin-D1 isoform X2 n=1 Tax=Callithrix jacchus TaxID=9483 RepID=UPI0023DCEFAD|nr:plexin-D1 isoform X2 [Callithrix jacchus]
MLYPSLCPAPLYLLLPPSPSPAAPPSSASGTPTPSRAPGTPTPPMLFSVLLQLHTTQKSQVFPLSLQLKGQPARFLDSPEPMKGKARYTLNEEWLLRENIEAKPWNLNVSFQGCGMDSLSVRAMDTDTLTQVKEKILEAFCKNVPYSQWPRAEDVDLEWFASSTQSYNLRDLDDTSVVEDGRKKLNTLAHYKIPEGASLAMSLIDKTTTTLGRVKDLDTEKYFHLVPPTDELTEPKKSHRQSHRKKVLPEIYLTRLLSTKGTLQKFLDDLFKAILSIHEDKPPLAVKYFFDFLEEQAEKRGISDPDTLHIWKTNSLPLRFWVNILKNPQFVFDIDKTDHIDACLSVIAQAFIDACSISDLQLGKDSPTNKLLYAKEIPEYRKIVQRYYKQIQDMTPLSEQEMNAHLAEESRSLGRGSRRAPSGRRGDWTSGSGKPSSSAGLEGPRR